MNRRGHLTVIMILTILGLLIGGISLYLQLHPRSSTDAYEQTIADACRARGYDYALFTQENGTEQVRCCRGNSCASYAVAMQYGPGYEPVGGGASR